MWSTSARTARTSITTSLPTTAGWGWVACVCVGGPSESDMIPAKTEKLLVATPRSRFCHDPRRLIFVIQYLCRLSVVCLTSVAASPTITSEKSAATSTTSLGQCWAGHMCRWLEWVVGGTSWIRESSRGQLPPFENMKPNTSIFFLWFVENSTLRSRTSLCPASSTTNVRDCKIGPLFSFFPPSSTRTIFPC